MSRRADFVVLHPDGAAIYGSRDRAQPVRNALGAHVPELSTQGLGRVRAWFADDFASPALRPNPLANQVLARLGYRHPSGWYGPVAVTMEEDRAGNIAELAPDVRDTVDELSATRSGADTRTVERFIDAEPGAPANPASHNRIRLTPRDKNVADREIVIGWDRGLGTYFAQVLDGTDTANEDIVRVDVGNQPDGITDPVQAVDAIRPYAEIPDTLVDELLQLSSAPGARQRSPFASWVQKASLPQDTAATADLIEDTSVGGSDFGTADLADEPSTPQPGPSTAYGPDL